MADSRNVVKFSELLEMCTVGSNAMQEYIDLRIQDVKAQGPEKLIKLLNRVQQQLNEKPDRKDSTPWLLDKDENNLKKLLGGTRKRLALPEKAQDQTLTLERMKAEILAAMMCYVLAKNQTREASQVSKLYVAAIDEYGTDADRALLSDAGLGTGVTYAAAAVSSFFGMGEKEGEKQRRVDNRKKQLLSVMDLAQPKADTLGYAVSDLLGSSDAFAELFADVQGGVDKIVDVLTSLASDADKMDSMNNASLLRIAASLEQTASFINKVIHEVGVINDPPLGERLKLYKQLQVVADQLFEKQHKLAGLMLERLKYLDADVLRDLEPGHVDFNKRYECDKRMEEWKQKLKPQTVELFRQQANKMADEDQSKEGKRIDMIDAAGIIKFQAYIAKSGTSDQKAELLGMQAATLSASPADDWLKTKLTLWNMVCPDEIQHFIRGIQDKNHYFETQADLEVLRKVLEIVLSYKNKHTMLGVLRYIDENNLIEDGNGFRDLSVLMANFQNTADSSFGRSGDKALDRLVRMCNDADDLSGLMSGISLLDDEQKKLFMRLLAMQDTSKDPVVPMIEELPQVYQLFFLVEEGKQNPVFFKLCDAMLKKFKNQDQKELLKLLGDCAKLSAGKYGANQLVSPQLILDILPQVDTMNDLLPRIGEVRTELEKAPLLNYLYRIMGLSKVEVNDIIKQVYEVDIVNDDDILKVIQEQQGVIGESCLINGFSVFAELVRNGLINPSLPADIIEASKSVMRLVNSVNLVINTIESDENDHKKLSARMQGMLEAIVDFKRTYKDPDGSNVGADAIIIELINQLAPEFTQNSDLRMVLYVNLVKAIARTPAIYQSDAEGLIESTIDLSTKYKGDHDGEQKLLKLATQSLRLIHSPQGKGEEMQQALKSLQEFGASAAFKRNILRFAKAVLSFFGKVIKPAAVKSEEMERKVGLFDVKLRSAKALHKRVSEVKDLQQPLPSSNKKPGGS